MSAPDPADAARLAAVRKETGTELGLLHDRVNALLAASTAKGETVIENAAAEPDIIVFGDMLRAMGAQLDGLGTHTITVQGVDGLKPVTFRNCPDRIELGRPAPRRCRRPS